MFCESRISSSLELLSLEIRNQSKAMKKTLAVAESCTGGLLGSLLTDHSGASSYFWGGIISYHNECKEKILKVRRQTLSLHGAVSCQTAQEMSKGLSNLSQASLCVSVTGIAGPHVAGSSKKVGTLWTSLLYQKLFYNQCFECQGSRFIMKRIFCLKVLFFISNFLNQLRIIR